ncbi:MAG: WecB/TagA/CpsF family glycosyltransferase [Chloroflexi bacterium]|nr:WecB/TagA/CpsF family glycosyltransferase [Chloroflexota bacterium]
MLGVRVDIVDATETLELITRWAIAGRPRQVVTINPEFVMRARVDPAFAAVLEHADLAIADGVGILWAARRQGVRLRERVGGSDIALPLARECAARGLRLFLLGAADGVAEIAAERLRHEAPGVDIARTFAGSPRVEDEDSIVERIRAAQPHILLVAYGAPAQDLWIARNQARAGVPVAIGVGGALDYLAGVQKRAPQWVQRLWLDWAFRLVTQPWRWRRMLALPRFVRAVLAQA